VTDQRTNWFQRLVGADGANLPAVEEQLARAKEEGQQLLAELAREREQVALRDQQLEEAKQRARATEQDFEARLIAVREASEQRQAAHEELEKQHKQTNGELAIARNQLVRQRDESAKLTKSLAATNATLAKAETAHQAACTQVAELEGKLTKEAKESQAARARVAELEKSGEASAKDAADAKRRLQAIETRASTVEHELVGTKQALQSAEAELQKAVAELQSLRAERDLAITMTNDSWRALERAVGDTAPLVLALGVETGTVEGRASLEDATAALKSALERRAHCQALNIDAEGDALLVELSAPHLTTATGRWLVAFTTAFLEKSLGAELSVESSSVEDNALTFRLGKSPPVA
jgi:hypothetical protein